MSCDNLHYYSKYSLLLLISANVVAKLVVWHCYVVTECGFHFFVYSVLTASSCYWGLCNETQKVTYHALGRSLQLFVDVLVGTCGRSTTMDMAVQKLWALPHFAVEICSQEVVGASEVNFLLVIL